MIPPKENAAFVASMEDVLEVYTRPHDPACPLICLDETSKQLTKETRTPIPVRPGREARVDYEYERNGVASLFRTISTPITRHHYIRHFHQLRHVVWQNALSGIIRPNMARGLYFLHPKSGDRFSDKCKDQKRKIIPKSRIFECFGYNIAESELSVLARQCLDRRIPHTNALKAEVQAWENERNQEKAKMKWRFTTEDARIKLAHLYPQID